MILGLSTYTYPLVVAVGACEIQDSIGVYVTTGSLVFYCFGPTDRKAKWGHSLCGNMYVAIMVKDRERASSEYIRIKELCSPRGTRDVGVLYMEVHALSTGCTSRMPHVSTGG